MLLSEKSKREDSSLRMTSTSSETSQSFGDQFSKIPYESFYNKEELYKLQNFYEILTSKKYRDFEEICHDIQCLINLSKYNLKRSSKTEKSNSITFVCSCNSRKKFRYETENSCEKKGKNSIEFEIINISGKCFGSKQKETKRFNLEACRFRIRFKIDSNFNITFVRDSNPYHNHPPSDKKTVKEFASISRNIKFPIETLNVLALKINEHLSNENCRIDNSFKRALNSLVAEKFSHDLGSSQIFRKICLKKLTYFINAVLKNYTNYAKYTDQRSKLFYYLYKSLSKHGGNYFRQDSLYVLNRELESLNDEQSCDVEEILSTRFCEKKQPTSFFI